MRINTVSINSRGTRLDYVHIYKLHSQASLILSLQHLKPIWTLCTLQSDTAQY
jgi:hypothetical protein